MKAAETFIIFTALSMQINASHFISFKEASYSACCLNNGDYIKSLLEKLTRENKVIAAVKKWKFFSVLNEIVEAAMQSYKIFPCVL